jgi:hypothetical protein
MTSHNYDDYETIATISKIVGNCNILVINTIITILVNFDITPELTLLLLDNKFDR